MIETHPELIERDVSDFRQHRNGGWVEKTAKVIKSIIDGQSLVLGNAKVELCVLQNKSIIKDNAAVIKSYISDGTTIEGNAYVEQSTLMFESMVSDNANVFGSTISESKVIDNASIKKSIITGNTTVKGTSNLIQCFTHVSTIDINRPAKQITLNGGVYNSVPLIIGSILLRRSIYVDADHIQIGCKKESLEWWKENAKEVWGKT